MNELLNNMKLDVYNPGIELLGEDDNKISICRVNSFSAFDYLISCFKKEIFPFNCSWNRFYRGVSNKEYDLICSLCVNDLEREESEIINQLYSLAPDEFSSCKTNFEMVSLMQHYGLPTRLLDFTKNPLVALWFACQRNANSPTDSDGAVYLALSSEYISKKLLDYVFKIALANKIDRIVDVRNVLTEEELKDYVMAYSLMPQGMCFVQAPLIDLRERNQQAVFLIGTNNLVISNKNEPYDETPATMFNLADMIIALSKGCKNKTVKFDKIKCYIPEVDGSFIVKIIIPKEIKLQILNELSYRGIDEMFIYPTLDNYCKHIKSQAKEIRQKHIELEKMIMDYAKTRNNSENSN